MGSCVKALDWGPQGSTGFSAAALSFRDPLPVPRKLTWNTSRPFAEESPFLGAPPRGFHGKTSSKASSNSGRDDFQLAAGRAALKIGCGHGSP